MIYFIYKTTNLINNKYYIGAHKTANIDDGYLGSGILLQRSVNKYGKNNFVREILQFCSSTAELFKIEKEIVNEVIINDEKSYNLKQGGDGGWDYVNTNLIINRSKPGVLNPMYGKSHTEKTKQQISRKKKGKKLGPMPPLQKQRLRQTKLKTYKLISPIGERYITNDLPMFCLQHNLNYRTIRWILTNKKIPSSGTSTGWWCEHTYLFNCSLTSSKVQSTNNLPSSNTV